MKIDHEISHLDQLDKAILEVVSQEGRLPVTDIARRVDASKTPCQVRLKRLIEKGYILGFRAILNPVLLEQEHVAFTEVKLSDTRENALEAFNNAVQFIREIEQCHMIAGAYDYLLKIRTENIRAYRRVLGEEISKLPFVASTSTFVAMESVKDHAF